MFRILLIGLFVYCTSFLVCDEINNFCSRKIQVLKVKKLMTDGPQCKYQDFIFRSLLIGKVGKSNLDCNQKDQLIFPLLQHSAVDVSIAHEGSVLTTCPVTHPVGLLQISNVRDD